MPDAKITELTEDTSPSLDDLLVSVNAPGTTPANRKIALCNLWSALNLGRGVLINGKIVPSVASNNLTVAIKGLDGNDPSATNPVYCRIGDTVRKITSALSVTKNAGTNWFNSGSTELATQEIDYFVYLGYNATDGVTIGFSRIPWANEYDDFSATSTNDKYCAISTITNASAGDDYEVIGRFGATLSAGAGYTWSVPTFTNKNLIQCPIFETRWLNMASGSITNLTIGNGTFTYNYQITKRKCDIDFYMNFGSTTSVSGIITLQLPMAALAGQYRPFLVTMLDSGTSWNMGIGRFNTATQIYLQALSSGGTYVTQNDTSANIPHTWANTDNFGGSFGYKLS